MSLLLGVDTGGTFTDFVILSEDKLQIHKVLSTPDDPSRAILQGLEDLNLFPSLKTGKAHLVHGSTVATNAALENKGVRTAYITNRGFTDILRIGRQARSSLYNLRPDPVTDPIPPAFCLGTGGRLNADGKLLEPITSAELSVLREQIKRIKPKAIAINMLFSFLDDSQEIVIEKALEDLAFISRSSYVLPEYREYERGIATWLNAWLGPLVQNYLNKLQRAISPASVSVMQSSGETIDARQAGQRAVNMLLSGPAGGLSAAAFIGRAINKSNIITFDMGGTSTDVSLLVGQPTLTNAGALGPYPVAIPMIDIHTIGAGGGSIAHIDDGGSLCVGPASAGANPGPAAYGLGGCKATVTDANMVLGRLLPSIRLSDDILLSLARATQAVDTLATRLELSVKATAAGIIKVAEQHMVRALQVISIERGFNPADFSIMCFGGAGGLHVCALAKQLDVSHIILPVHGGVFSALGMLVSNPGRQLVRTVNKIVSVNSTSEHHMHGQIDDKIEALFESLVNTGSLELAAEGHNPRYFNIQKSVALRYQGQSFTLTLAWQQNQEQLINVFHAAHHKRYGHNFDLPIELVNVLVQVSVESMGLELPRLLKSKRSLSPKELSGELPLYDRAQLLAGDRFSGPALVTEKVATSYIAAGWCCEVDQWGHLHLKT